MVGTVDIEHPCNQQGAHGPAESDKRPQDTVDCPEVFSAKVVGDYEGPHNKKPTKSNSMECPSQYEGGDVHNVEEHDNTESGDYTLGHHEIPHWKPFSEDTPEQPNAY